MNVPPELLERFKKGELIPAIAQEQTTGEVLMLAWMNQDRNNSEVMSVLLKNKTKEQAKALALYFAFH